jgi:hypothetical protein
MDRRPTEEEQRIIVALSEGIARLRNDQQDRVLAIGMGPEEIEDREHGRWNFVFGRPVVEVPLDGIFLLLKVEP